MFLIISISFFPNFYLIPIFAFSIQDYTYAKKDHALNHAGLLSFLSLFVLFVLLFPFSFYLYSMTSEPVIKPGEGLDKSTFETLFRHFFPALMSFAKKYVPDEDDAREVVHKVFIALWEKRDSLDTSTSFKSYLFTSVHNRSLNFLRDRKKFSDGEMPDIMSDQDVHAQMESMELEEKIQEVIASLPEKCRQVFEMNRFEGLKYAEIAEKLGISVKTVENQMSKALKILREKLAHYLALVVWILWNGLN